ncbi:hypothetical protein ID866_12668 [Astraeus odoratus]|nr:hypothetical protein ID866_12668 [Astraeus odoratus]
MVPGVMTQTLTTQTTMMVVMTTHQTQTLRTILSSRSPMPSLASPTLLGADPKTQGLCAPKSMSPTPLTAQTRKNSTCGRSALPSPSSRALPSPGSNPTSWMPSLAPTPHGPTTTLSLSSSSLPISAPTTLSAMLNTNLTTCR